MPKSGNATTSSPNPLSGDISKDLSPMTPAFTLSGDIEKDLESSPAPETPAKPTTQNPAQNPPSFMARLEGGLTGRDPQSIMQRGQALASNLQRTGGYGAPASLAVPGGPLAQAAIQPLVGATQAAIGGERSPLGLGKAAAGAEAGTLAGLGVGKVAKAVASPLLHRVASSQKAGELARYLSEKVPAWAKFGSDEAALSKMLKSTRGYNALHRGYDDTLNGVIAKAEGQRISLSLEDAKALGIKEWVGSKDPAVIDVEVDAVKAARAVLGKWKETPALYRRVSRALDEKGIGDPAGRAAYKTGIGAREFIDKSKSVKSGKLDLYKSQQGLENDKTGDLLRRRQLGDVEGILRGGVKTGSEPVGGRPPITKMDPKAHGGIFGIKPPVPSFYGNVPSGPLTRTAGQLIPRAGAEAGSQLSQ